MKGDFTRFSFKPGKHYIRVLRQQGRVDLDADWNEQVDISEHLDRSKTRDVVGPTGVPKARPGFGIHSQGDGGLSIGPGRMYVDGLLVELDRALTYRHQPDYPTAPGLHPHHQRTDLVYLDVWERHVTALEDEDIQERALGGPDTATRVQVVGQVKVIPGVAAKECHEPVAEFDQISRRSGLRLSTLVDPPATSQEPCDVTGGGGFRGLENRLYRVEIHSGGEPYVWPRPSKGYPSADQLKEGGISVASPGFHGVDWAPGQAVEVFSGAKPGTLFHIATVSEAANGGRHLTFEEDLKASRAELSIRPIATFKWSRDNGSVVVGAEAIVGDTTIRLRTLGRDDLVRLRVGDWVEVLGDETDLSGRAGTLARIADVDAAALTIQVSKSVARHEHEHHLRVRRWDMASDAIPVTYNEVPLEDGIKIRFGSQDAAFAVGLHGVPLDVRAFTPHGVSASSELSVGRTELLLGRAPREAMPSLSVEHVFAKNLPMLRFETILRARAGDYWPFAARTGNSPIEAWVEPLAAAEPRGIRHHVARLALVTWQRTEKGFAAAVKDCRRRFPALTQLEASDVAYEDTKCHLGATTVQEALDQLCKARAAPPTRTSPKGPGVKEISWRNDRTLNLDTFNEQGLKVTFTEAMNTACATANAFVVQLEVPIKRSPAGHTPFLVHGRIRAEENGVAWRFRPEPPIQHSDLRAWLQAEDSYFTAAPLRCRVTLKGNFILTADATKHLDGDVQGKLVEEKDKSALVAGTGHYVDLALPSGSGRSSGDFESWFFLDLPKYRLFRMPSAKWWTFTAASVPVGTARSSRRRPPDDS